MQPIGRSDVAEIADSLQLNATILQNLLKVALTSNVALAPETDALVRAAQKYVADIQKISQQLCSDMYKGESA